MLDVLGSPLCAFLPAKQSHNSIYACRAVLMRRQACTLFCGRCGRFELTRRSSGRASPLTIPVFVQPSFLLSLCPPREGGWSGCLSRHRLNAVAKQILRVQRPRSVSTRLCIRRLRECARTRSQRPLLSLAARIRGRRENTGAHLASQQATDAVQARCSVSRAPWCWTKPWC